MAITGLFTIAGIAALKDLIYDETKNHFLYVAIGTDNTTAAISQTALVAEHARAAATITASDAKKILWAVSVAATDTVDIYEFGIFDASTGGNMLWRGVSDTAYSLTSGEYMGFDLEVTLAGLAVSTTTAGLNEVRNLIGDLSTPSGFDYLAYGTGTGAESASDTTLGTETDREQCSSSEKVTYTVRAPNDTLMLYKTFTAASAVTVSEVGIFNASTGGDMLARSLIAAADRETLAVGDKFVVTYRITPYG